jgi:hypothetical protein
VHRAHRVRDRCPDGQLYVNLRGFSVKEPVTPGEALAGSLSALGDVAAAAEELTAAVDLYRTLDDAHNAAKTLLDLAALHLAEHDHAGARRALGEATTLRAESPDPHEDRRLAGIAASLEAAERRSRVIEPGH